MSNKRTIISEEKIFGKGFVVIRRKYAPEDSKKNIFKDYLQRENRF